MIRTQQKSPTDSISNFYYEQPSAARKEMFEEAMSKMNTIVHLRVVNQHKVQDANKKVWLQ